MSRTKRNNPTNHRDHFVYYIGNERYDFWLSNGGWKEAKKILTKEDYAKARSNCGDNYFHHSYNGGVPWWFRNELEKQHRQHTRRELHRFIRNAEYDPMVPESPDSDGWYYW